MPLLRLFSLVLALLIPALSPEGGQASLNQTVAAFWEALSRHDKVTALQYVHPDDKNNFINRKEGLFSDWKVERTEWRSDTEVIVTVGIDKILPDGTTLPVEVSERWERVENAWKLRVTSLKSRVEALAGYFEERKREKMPERLAVAPGRLRFYALTPSQPATLYIRNGLHVPVTIVELTYDQTLFELIRSISQVASRSVSGITLRYQGKEKAENLSSEIGLKIRANNQIREFRIPVTYNFQDDVTRWLKLKSTEKP